MRPLIALGLVFLTGSLFAQSLGDGSGRRADIEQLQREIKAIHPNPFLNISEARWDSAAADLKQSAGGMTASEYGIALQKLVALLGDAHTSVNPQRDAALSSRRYPIELYFFEDGLHVRSAAPEYAELVGGRILNIGNVDPGHAVSAVAATISYENTWWIRAMAPERLVIPEVLDGLGLASGSDRLTVAVEKGGARHEAEVTPVSIDRPVHSGDRAALDKSGWIDMLGSTDRPLWLQRPGDPMWHARLDDSTTLYVCYREVTSPDEGLSNAEFWDEIFAEVDRGNVERLVIDIRENSGGNGMLNRGVVQQIVRRPDLDRSDRLFVIIGRRTFSAGQQLANQLDWWTQATFVGEPTGQKVSQYGDAARIRLKNSGISLLVSTRFHQSPNPLDNRNFLPPDLYAPMTSEDYREGRDPALEAILVYDELDHVMPRVIGALQAGQFDVVERLLANAAMDPVNRYRNFEADMNALGYDLLERGQADAAIAVFEVNTHVYPTSANAFDSLGEALAAVGRYEEAIQAYRQALSIDPTFPSAVRALRRLENGDR